MKWFQRLRYGIEYLLFRGIVGFVRLLPVDLAAAISGRIWRFLAPLNRRHKRALTNLELAFPDKTTEERELIACQMWENLGRVMAETMQLDRILSDSRRVHLVNRELLQDTDFQSDSIMLVSLHTGNWELAVSPFTEAGFNPGAVYRLVDNPYIDTYVRKIRRNLYPAGLFAKGGDAGRRNGQRVAKLLVNFVRKGGRLGVLCDLYDRKGTAVPFFGRPARSTPIPAMMARKMGSRIWLLRCVRVCKKSQFKIELKELDVPRTDDSRADITRITTAIQAQFEEWIRQYPEQWMWSNRRWS
ncbi:MAG: lysophospholipid acyltransferase family protein [Methyloligellaceae bacterium]